MLFVDEIHRLNRAVEEILYPALEDFRLDIVFGQGAGGADADARPAAVHARRRDDAHRAADDAAARPLRDDVPARLLRRRASSATIVRRSARHPRRRDRRRRGRRDRAPLARHAADREPDPAARARRRRGAPRRARSRPRSPSEALELLEVDGEGLERIDRELLDAIVDEVRRRAGRALDARRRARRGAGHDRGRLRAVPAPARLPPAHAARAHHHRARPRRTSGRRATTGACSERAIWTPGDGGTARRARAADPATRSSTSRRSTGSSEAEVERRARRRLAPPAEDDLGRAGVRIRQLARTATRASREELIVPARRDPRAPDRRARGRAAARLRGSAPTPRRASAGTAARARTASARARAAPGRPPARRRRTRRCRLVPHDLEQPLLDAVVEVRAAEDELAQPVDERLAVDEREPLPVAHEVRAERAPRGSAIRPSAASSTRSADLVLVEVVRRRRARASLPPPSTRSSKSRAPKENR